MTIEILTTTRLSLFLPTVRSKRKTIPEPYKVQILRHSDPPQPHFKSQTYTPTQRCNSIVFPSQLRPWFSSLYPLPLPISAINPMVTQNAKKFAWTTTFPWAAAMTVRDLASFPLSVYAIFDNCRLQSTIVYAMEGPSSHESMSKKWRTYLPSVETTVGSDWMGTAEATREQSKKGKESLSGCSGIWIIALWNHLNSRRVDKWHAWENEKDARDFLKGECFQQETSLNHRSIRFWRPLTAMELGQLRIWGFGEFHLESWVSQELTLAHHHSKVLSRSKKIRFWIHLWIVFFIAERASDYSWIKSWGNRLTTWNSLPRSSQPYSTWRSHRSYKQLPRRVSSLPACSCYLTHTHLSCRTVTTKSELIWGCAPRLK